MMTGRSARRLVVAHPKGGAGRTTTAVHLAAGLAEAGHRTLLIDLDPQAVATRAYLGSASNTPTVRDLLLEDSTSLEDVVVSVRSDLDIVPSEIGLSFAVERLATSADGRTRLRGKLELASPAGYECVVMDTPPSLASLTLNALTAGSTVVIPVSLRSAVYLDGVTPLVETIEGLRDELGDAAPDNVGILCTMDRQTDPDRRAVALVRELYPDSVCSTVVPWSAEVAASPSAPPWARRQGRLHVPLRHLPPPPEYRRDSPSASVR